MSLGLLFTAGTFLVLAMKSGGCGISRSLRMGFSRMDTCWSGAILSDDMDNIKPVANA